MAATLQSLPQSFKSANANAGPAVPASKMKAAQAHMPNGRASGSVPVEPFYRVDTMSIKKKLVEQLREDFWPYWSGLKEFLTGRARRDEFEGIVKPYMDTEVKRALHNQLLLALLHNASSNRPIHDTPTLTSQPTNINGVATHGRKRSRADVELDDHEVFIRPKFRVQKWVLGMSKSARAALKADLAEYERENGEEATGKQLSEMVRGWQGRRPRAAAGRRLFGATQDLTAPQCSTMGVLPTEEEMQQVLDAIAKENGLVQGAGERAGEFLVVALETHLENVLHAAVQLKYHDLPPPSLTITTPAAQKIALTSEAQPISGLSEQPPYPSHLQQSNTSSGELSLADMHALLDLAPHVHPHAGSAVFKLRHGIFEAEEEEERVALQMIEAKLTAWEQAKQNSIAAMLAGGKLANGHAGDGSVASASRVEDGMDVDDKTSGGIPISRGASPPATLGVGSLQGQTGIKQEQNGVGVPEMHETYASHHLFELESKGLLKIQDATEKKRPNAAGAAGALPLLPLDGVAKANGTPTPVPGMVKKEKKEESQTHWQYVDPSEILRDILG